MSHPRTMVFVHSLFRHFFCRLISRVKRRRQVYFHCLGCEATQPILANLHVRLCSGSRREVKSHIQHICIWHSFWSDWIYGVNWIDNGISINQTNRFLVKTTRYVSKLIVVFSITVTFEWCRACSHCVYMNRNRKTQLLFLPFAGV